MFRNNPKQAQRKISEIINKNLIAMLKAKITFDGIKGTNLPNIFKAEKRKTYLDAENAEKFQKNIESDFSLKAIWIFENLIKYDGDFESEIVREDSEIENIEIFGKLPRLEIKTPLGNYNPDFCYVIKNKKGNEIFFIMESEDCQPSTDISENEKAKIDFAKKHFETLTERYEEHNIKILFKERINKTQLAALINSERL